MVDKGHLRIVGGSAAPVLGSTADVVGSKAWALKIRKRAKELSGQLDVGYMEMAKILYDVFDVPIDGDPKNPPVFTSWGYKTFEEYSTTELHMHQRKAQRLRRIWWVLAVYCKDIPDSLRAKIVALGYSKVRELTRVLSNDTAERWVKLAEKTSYPGLVMAISKAVKARDAKQAEEVRARRAAAGKDPDEDGVAATATGGADEDEEQEEPALPQDPEPEQLFHQHFAFYAAQNQNVAAALEEASKISGSDKKSHNLDLICTEFRNTNSVVKGEERLRYLAKVERMLHLKIMAVEPRTGEMVYGIEALQLVAGTMKPSGSKVA